MKTPHEAAQAARATTRNIINACQYTVRDWLDAPSAGDFDGDGAADAEDGWKKEPKRARRFTRDVPEGYPVTYSGGSNDNWHRALSLGNGKIRSTDAPEPGVTSTVDLDWPEKAWGLTYVGWSKTMDGIPIPPNPPKTRGIRVEKARALLRRSQRNAKAGTLRFRLLRQINSLLYRIPKEV